MKKFIKYLAVILLAFTLFGVVLGYVGGVDNRILAGQNKQSLIVYKDPITRQTLFP